jgi:hypothetical protein
MAIYRIPAASARICLRRGPETRLSNRISSVDAKPVPSPEALGKSPGAPIDTALALDEGCQRLRKVFELRGVPQNARPFASGPKIRLCGIGCALDHSSERLRISLYKEMPAQSKCPLGIFDGFPLMRPP